MLIAKICQFEIESFHIRFLFRWFLCLHKTTLSLFFIFLGPAGDWNVLVFCSRRRTERTSPNGKHMLEQIIIILWQLYLLNWNRNVKFSFSQSDCFAVWLCMHDKLSEWRVRKCLNLVLPYIFQSFLLNIVNFAWC